MYLAKCPLRISLIGGSTDLQEFIDKYEHGAVISFPSNLHVYISIHDNNRNKYILNYSRKEEVETIDEISNDVARVGLKHFGVGPVTISFESDIISTGSGLASSTAFMIALVKALSMYTKQHMTEYEVCKTALQLERQFNPGTGYQDPYGCGIGGFKRIDFRRNRNPSFSFLDAEFLYENFDMALYHTKTSRSSTKVLKSVDVDRCKPLLDKVDELEKHILDNDIDEFLSVFNEGWQIKKTTSSLIVGDETFKQWDEEFEKNPNILGVKLCFVPGTKISTPNRQRCIEDIFPGEVVLDHQMTPQKVTKVFKRAYNGQILEFTVAGCKDTLCVTPEHPLMFTAKDVHAKRRKNIHGQKRLIPNGSYFKEAGQFQEGECLLIPICSDEQDISYFTLERKVKESKYSKYNIYQGIPSKIPIDFDFLNILGWFTAEGSANRTQFQFAMHKKELAQAKTIAKSFSDLFGKKVKITTENNSLRIVGSSIVLADMFSNLCGKHAVNKQIPKFIMRLPKKKQAIYLSALWNGDGCVVKNLDSRTHKTYMRCSFKTISPVLAEQVQQLCFRLGFISSLRKEKERKNRQQSYVVDITGPDAKAFIHLISDGKLVKVVRQNKKQLSLKKDIIDIDGVMYVKRPIRKIKTKHYSGMVHNLAVKNTHTYIANNIAVHNCGAGGGGYFFALCAKGFIPETINGSPAIPIEVNETGLVGQVF